MCNTVYHDLIVAKLLTSANSTVRIPWCLIITGHS